MRFLEKLAAGAGYVARFLTSPRTWASVLGVLGAFLVYCGVEGWSPEAARVVLGVGLLYLSWVTDR